MKLKYYRSSFLLPYLHFTAYSVTSTSSEAGTCTKHTGSPVPLSLEDPYVVSVPTNVIPGSLTGQDSNAFYTAYYSTFLDDAYSSLNTILGYESCTAVLPSSVLSSLLATSGILYLPNVASETATTTTTPFFFATATALPSATATESSVPVQHIHKTQIIIVSVVVPTIGLVTFLLCFIILRRYRKKRRQAAIKNQWDMTSNTQLYVDQKAELEDEERRKFELDAGGITYEMEGEDRIFEMPTTAEMRLASLRETHEMRGVEHSQELGVPGSAT